MVLFPGVTLNTAMEYGFDLYNLRRIFMTGEGMEKNHKSREEFLALAKEQLIKILRSEDHKERGNVL